MTVGILVDYEFCTGCHTCEIACAVSHDLPNDRAGVVVHHEGAWEMANGKWQDTYLPVFTDVCDQCAGASAAHDGAPMCVHHCQADVLRMGDAEELAKELVRKPKQLLYTLA
ncbi:4Fe-4S dicluster domain-containing protein [Ellagibacter isourolithinifaciens]|uniref:4Fe-4S dicluster domain-containing protein n=1 Tax=Ellagibacter isourolithinifaciens TaxID=2137581 RepID=UPI0023F522AF|nr:4Fe-4S dicluster domain-containing protein [Ellagibacter isourolithinifaciens]MDD5925848.1 4Fe-4S dicluster domain-containing protein [Ellagibacter isourolithinifaciens]